MPNIEGAGTLRLNAERVKAAAEALVALCDTEFATAEEATQAARAARATWDNTADELARIETALDNAGR